MESTSQSQYIDNQHPLMEIMDIVLDELYEADNERLRAILESEIDTFKKSYLPDISDTYFIYLFEFALDLITENRSLITIR